MNEQQKEQLKEKCLAFKQAHDELVMCAKGISQDLMWRVDGFLEDDMFYDFIAELGIDDLC